ncbi:aldo/keto reductase [Lentzea sp. NPDC058450]|uniref:aldo/keto reductase n=1 Tax=Lentzea sp. NPDC058450 TaxID=3346505 RepID=UPI003660D554
MNAVPEISLNNGVTLPALGFGVFQSAPEETVAAVETALATGYRHIDTAAVYFNEREVGEAVRRSGVDRSEIFLETKVWVSDYGYEQTLHAFDKSALKLGVEQIDLLLLHQPVPSAFERTIGSYRALEKLLDDGRVRAIGVSNFTAEHLKMLIEQTEVVPAVNQVELHPYFSQRELREVADQHGIVTQAWSPIGGVTFYPDTIGWGAKDRTSTLTEPVILGIAEAHGRSAAQVMLAWHLQQGRSAIPKSVKPERIAENFDVFDIKLSAEELAALDALDRGVRNGPDPEAITPENSNWPIPEA